jgi:uncharacterized protein with HEPN domain
VTRTIQERLTDISEAAERVIRAVAMLEQAEADGRDDEAQLAFDALLYRLVVIGEAVKALPEDLRARQPQIPWREIARLRDLLAHHYYRVDARVIRRTVESPLTDLQRAVIQMLALAEPGSTDLRGQKR